MTAKRGALAKPRGSRRLTITELVFPLDDPEALHEVEEFRIEWERDHGPVDLTRRYTSTLPDAQQTYLMDHHPERYFAGLPEFAQAWIQHAVESRATQGRLDEVPVAFLKLLTQGKLRRSDKPGHSF